MKRRSEAAPPATRARYGSYDLRRNGKTKQGKQQYECKACNYYGIAQNGVVQAVRNQRLKGGNA